MIVKNRIVETIAPLQSSEATADDNVPKDRLACPGRNFYSAVTFVGKESRTRVYTAVVCNFRRSTVTGRRRLGRAKKVGRLIGKIVVRLRQVRFGQH